MSEVCRRGYKCMCFQCGEKDCERDDSISRAFVLSGLDALRPVKPKGPESVMETVNRSAWDCALNCAEAVVRTAPPQSERKRGRWQEITEGDYSGYDPVLAGYDDPVVGYVCSVCHEGYEKEVMGETTWDYCPNCGAKMGGEQDG